MFERVRMKFLMWLLQTFYKEFGVVYHVKIKAKINKTYLLMVDEKRGWIFHEDALLNPYAAGIDKLILMENWIERLT